MIKRVFVFLLPILAIVGTVARIYFRGGFDSGPTNIEVIEQYRPQYASFHDRLAEIAAYLSEKPPVEEFTLHAKPADQVVIDVADAQATNAAIMPLSDFAGVADSKYGGDERVVFLLTNDPLWMSSCLAWTGDDNPLARSIYDRNGSDLEKKLSRALQLKYAFLGRIHWQIVEDDATGTKPLKADVFLVDVKTGKLLASIPVTGPPAEPLRAYPFIKFGDQVIQQISETLADSAAIRLNQ